MSRNEIAQKMKEINHWGYAMNDDFLNILGSTSGNTVQVRSVQNSDGLFTVGIMTLSATGDAPGFESFYTCINEKEWHKQYENIQFTCFPVEDENNGSTTLMKINPRSGLIICAPLNDPEKDDYILEWPVQNSAEGYRWFIRPTMHRNHFIRTYLDSYGVLRVQTTRVPDKGAEKLKSTDCSVDTATIPCVIDYPIMAHWHPWN